MFFALQLLSYIVTYVRLFQLVNTSNAYGGGYYNASTAAEVRWNRILDSKARNPTFDFTSPRYVTAYAESVFPFRFFVDGRNQSGALDLKSARGFFQRGQFPTGFHRRNGSFGLNEIGPDVDAVAAVRAGSAVQSEAPAHTSSDHPEMTAEMLSSGGPTILIEAARDGILLAGRPLADFTNAKS